MQVKDTMGFEQACKSWILQVLILIMLKSSCLLILAFLHMYEAPFVMDVACSINRCVEAWEFEV